MKLWEMVCIVSSLVVVGLFSGPRIALSRSFKTFHPKLFLGIISHMNQTMAPVLTVFMPVSVLAMIPILADSHGSNSLAFGLSAASLALNLLALIVVVTFELPLVSEIAAWTTSSIPEDWHQHRDKWQLAHVVRVITGVLSLLLLVAASLLF
jgi:hypothetical protein